MYSNVPFSSLLPLNQTLILIESSQLLLAPKDSLMDLTDELFAQVEDLDDFDVSLQIAVQQIEEAKMRKRKPEPIRQSKKILQLKQGLQLRQPLQSLLAITPNKSKKPGCSCKKTKCMKLYCECLAEGVPCRPECSCSGCENNTCESINHVVTTVAIIKKKQNKGCNCRKTFCLKKYCECYGEGKMCGSQCSCVGCQNCLK